MQGMRYLFKYYISFLLCAAAADDDVCRNKSVLQYLELDRAFLRRVSYSRHTIKRKKTLLALSQIQHRKD
jgi:hypothetical protein